MKLKLLVVGLIILLSLFFLLSSIPHRRYKRALAQTFPLGDLNHDGLVNLDDLRFVLTNFFGANPNADLTPDQKINTNDYAKESQYIAQSATGVTIYGGYIAVAKDQVTNTTLVTSELDRMKALGINLVGQIFSGTSTETEWQIFADSVEAAGMTFVPLIRDEIPTFNEITNTWDLGIHGEFLTAMKDHPALYAMFLYDEPHRHGIIADRVAFLYNQAKALAPNVKIGIGFSGEIWRAETEQYGANSSLFAFRRGLCDVCSISGLEFRTVNGVNEYQRQDAIDNHTYSRTAIAREASEVEVWSTIQTFGNESSTYYMPSPTELQDLIDVILSPEIQAIKPLSGFNYQTWGDPEPGQDRDSLGDPPFQALRDIVKATAISLGLPVL